MAVVTVTWSLFFTLGVEQPPSRFGSEDATFDAARVTKSERNMGFRLAQLKTL